MSIAYGFVNKKRKQDCEDMTKFIAGLKADVLKKLEQYGEGHPEMIDDVARRCFDVEHCSCFQPINYNSDDSFIGTMSARSFYWGQNFQSKDDVLNYARTHPDDFIENEYHQPISLQDFINNI